jgi:pimeloyl-ACP methyl ester carboxylesterase
MNRSEFLALSSTITTAAGSGAPVAPRLPAPYGDFDSFVSFLVDRNTKQYARVPSGGIYEESFVSIGGIEQWVTLHGDDRTNPVLLFLHGGPGDTTNPWTFILFKSWQHDFTIVQWDQRGAGKTLQRNGDGIASTITIDRMVQDGVELTDYLCSHLNKKRIIVVAHSFGTILGLTMMRRSPQRYLAYVGTGEVADSTKNYFVAYNALLAYARATNNAQATSELLAVGAPPYASGAGFQVQRKWSNHFEGADEFLPGTIGLRLTAPGGGVQSVVDDAAGELFSANLLVPQISKLTAADLGFSFEVPIFFIQGEIDFTTPTVAAQQYFDAIRAPQKDFATIEGGGHFSVFMHSEAFLQRLTKFVTPLAG